MMILTNANASAIHFPDNGGMPVMWRGYFLFILNIILPGCATPRSEVLTKTETYPATLHAEVLLDWPKRPYKIFASLEDQNGGTPEEINARLSRNASEIGADAVVIVSINDKSVTDWLLADPYYGVHGYYHRRYRPVKHTYHRVRAKALKYTK